MTRGKAPTGRSKVSSATGAELLFEIGVEELPYQVIAPAMSALKEAAGRLLEEARLAIGSVNVYGTPRRLTLVINGLALRQASAKKEVMGPSKVVGFDSQGQPTKAAIGFAAGQGLSVERLEVRRTPKGEYLFAVKEEGGRPAQGVLLELLPQLLGKLSFPKAMKWNETAVRFARPVRWLIAQLNGALLPIEAVGIRAGDRTYGHRVMGPRKPLVVRSYESYRTVLERAGVLVDPARRRQVIEQQLRQICSKAAVELNADESLMDQAVFTTEWPCALLGRFKPEYLSLPEEILMTSMKEHQGFFSVRDNATGKLAPHFITVANNQPKDMSLIQAGNERVLAARLADAKFFFDEDRRTRLEDRVKKLSGVTFHQKLGTMGQKAERLVQLVSQLASGVDRGSESQGFVNACRRAAHLSKADLLTGIVGEFPELQGIMGGEYAKHDGEPEPVNQAIREQYLPKALEGELPQSLPGLVLSLADRLDTVVAFFHVGMVPTGSEDPFALRRQATAIVRIILEKELRLDLGKYIDHARTLIVDSGIKGAPDSEQHGPRRVIDFVFERVRHYGRTVHEFRDDVMDAVLRPAFTGAVDLVDLLFKLKALQEVTAKPDFDPLIAGFKRASRIIEKEQWDHKPVDPRMFQEAGEHELHRQIRACQEDFEQHMAAGAYDRALDALVRLKPAIDAFFDGVMVNVEDAALRSNRLSLLKDVNDCFASFADFSRIMVQGG
ncbi:MAG TPA: glycine--tRNA ligase subunit beta [Nitrospira sp.]|nr:glycine--tRNA ligase subunit beta [Nitrospira sp.]